jgi:hypothetical protein
MAFYNLWVGKWNIETVKLGSAPKRNINDDIDIV